MGWAYSSLRKCKPRTSSCSIMRTTERITGSLSSISDRNTMLSSLSVKPSYLTMSSWIAAKRWIRTLCKQSGCALWMMTMRECFLTWSFFTSPRVSRSVSPFASHWMPLSSLKRSLNSLRAKKSKMWCLRATRAQWNLRQTPTLLKIAGWWKQPWRAGIAQIFHNMLWMLLLKACRWHLKARMRNLEI